MSEQNMPKIITSNELALSLLGDRVALSPGAKAIYYGGEKHPTDTPAYRAGDYTMLALPVAEAAFGASMSYSETTHLFTYCKGDETKEWVTCAPVEVKNGVVYLPLEVLATVLRKKCTRIDEGILAIGDEELLLADKKQICEVRNYLLFDRPNAACLKERFAVYNGSSHPRVMMDREIYDRVLDNFANDPDVHAWGEQIIKAADALLARTMPTYDIPDGYRLLATSRDIYGRAKCLSMAYILTKNPVYAENLYEVFSAAMSFPDWNPQHFLDVGEMICAFAIGYDWCYDYWCDAQRDALADAIRHMGLERAEDAYYGRAARGWWTPGNHTNWNVVCNGGSMMGAVAIFDRDPDYCAHLIELEVRDVEAMMNSFYPDGAWFEGIGYWSYTLAYTVNMFSTLESCFGTDFGLSMAPGFEKTVFFNMAGDGNTGINNFHDVGAGHQSSDTYFWLSNKFGHPGATNVRLYHMQARGYKPTPFDILWYDTSIKGTSFQMEKDTYLRGVEFVAMTGSWVDDSSAWLSYHGGVAVANHSHLDTGSFVFDLAGIRWAQDLGSDNYNLPGYFSSQKHNFYRMRPEGHNLYIIDPDETPGQTLDHFATVECLVSKERGAYSVLDLTSAYRDRAKRARRGYMLGDERRSATIRDEITFDRAGRELIWFMNPPKDAEIEIADRHTAFITSSEGVTLKFMIDSDIADYEFGVMDARPMPLSPVVEGQNENKGIRKLYLKGIAGEACHVTAKMILASDGCADRPLSLSAIDEWQIPDGEWWALPTVGEILSDGERIPDFDPKQTNYNRVLLFDDAHVPTVSASVKRGQCVEIKQPERPSDKIEVKVFYTDAPEYVRVYTLTARVMPRLEDVGDYHRIGVIGHTASATPEPAHAAINVSDNDTSPESRWAATGTAWLTLELAASETVDAVGIAVWHGGSRTYGFRIEVSEDGEHFTEVIAPRATELAYGEEIGIYPFDAPVTARYLRYTGSGNSVNGWNSVTELAVLRKK